MLLVYSRFLQTWSAINPPLCNGYESRRAGEASQAGPTSVPERAGKKYSWHGRPTRQRGLRIKPVRYCVVYLSTLTRARRTPARQGRWGLTGEDRRRRRWPESAEEGLLLHLQQAARRGRPWFAGAKGGRGGGLWGQRRRWDRVRKRGATGTCLGGRGAK
jgi:hypothetical protein